MAMVYLFMPEGQTADKLGEILRKQSYDVLRMDAEDGLRAEAPALAVLDAGLKWTSCRPLLEKLKRHECPIIFITSDRRMSAHLRTLYQGSSEVLAAPFSPRSLISKAKALLNGGSHSCGISVDEKARVAMLDGRKVELTAQELALLMALLEKPDTPLSREQLLRRAWGYQSMGETRTVDVHVQRLRRKLGGEYIETVYKCGYRLKLA